MLQESLPSPKRSIVFSWMKLLADITVVIGVLVCMVLIIGYSIDLYRHGKQKIYIGWFSSAGFVLLTIPISLRIIVQHLTHWFAPNVQKYIVRIVWMIPIYSVESWIALRFKFMAVYLEKIRESYEAYVIFCFLYYLIALLGGDEQQLACKLRKQAADIGKQSWFSPLVGTKPTGSELLRRCKLGVFQYVIVKNVVAIIACILESQGLQHVGDFSFNKPYIYQTFLENISQLWALYCLVVFYVATKDELSHWKPVGKFLCVKMVVFFTWWQSIFIEILFASPRGEIIANNTEDSWTVTEISKGLQDYLICIEMFFASIAFSMAFSYRDYDSYRAKKRFIRVENQIKEIQGDEEDHGLLASSVPPSSHGNTVNTDDDTYYYEIDTEARPFLSAFFQSSIPDDIWNDFRKLTKFSSTAWGRVSGGTNGTYASVDTEDFFREITPVKQSPLSNSAPHMQNDLQKEHDYESSGSEDEILSPGNENRYFEHGHDANSGTLTHLHQYHNTTQNQSHHGKLNGLELITSKINRASTPPVQLQATPSLTLVTNTSIFHESSPRLSLITKSMSFRSTSNNTLPPLAVHGASSGSNGTSVSGNGTLLSARRLPLQPDDAVVGFDETFPVQNENNFPPTVANKDDKQNSSVIIEENNLLSNFTPENHEAVPAEAQQTEELQPQLASSGWSFFSS